MVLLFKQKPAYEVRISDWSSDVCSSDLLVMDHDLAARQRGVDHHVVAGGRGPRELLARAPKLLADRFAPRDQRGGDADRQAAVRVADDRFGERNVQRAFLGDRKSTRLNSSH